MDRNVGMIQLALYSFGILTLLAICTQKIVFATPIHHKQNIELTDHNHATESRSRQDLPL